MFLVSLLIFQSLKYIFIATVKICAFRFFSLSFLSKQTILKLNYVNSDI